MDSEGMVLFVDDEDEIISALKRLFRSEPYHTSFASDAEEALRLMAAESVHVLVTDMCMPRMDGPGLLGRVQSLYPNTIRLVLSAYADSDTILDAINAGSIYRYIIKPWDNRDIKIVVRQALEVFSLQKANRELVEKLEEQNRLLEQRVHERTRQLLKIRNQAEIGKYASQIVHNLNNPLHSLAGALDFADMVLKNHPDRRDKLAEAIGLAQSGAQKLKRIISGILTHVRNETTFHLDHIDLNQLVEEELAYFDMNPLFREKIVIRRQLAPQLPQLLGNPIQFKQIIDNLISNAIDAMASSPEKILSIHTRTVQGGVILEVADTGEGIAPEHLARIFSADFTTKPVGKGTGLGLASVKTMVEAYSGRIDVSSKVGQGSRFIVQIPASARHLPNIHDRRSVAA